MKYKLFVFVILPLCVSCGRLANDMSASGVPAFNFTDKYNQMYEYDGYVKQVNTASEVNTVSYLSANSVLVSGKNNINVYTDEGAILFRYEPNESVNAATSSGINRDIFYATKTRDIKKYNRSTGSLEVLAENIYPLPTQLIVNNDETMLYYHDKFNVFSIDLLTFEQKKLTKIMLPIYSITLNEDQSQLYFSTSNDGRIYNINLNNKRIGAFHKPISVIGASLYYKNNQLYFTKSNGMHISIQCMDTLTKEVTEIIELSNMNYINNLVVLDD